VQLISGATRIVAKRSRRFSITRVCHDPRNRARDRRQERDERLPAESALAHEAVHQERGAGHVPAVFQHGDEREEDQNLRRNTSTPPTPFSTPSTNSARSGPIHSDSTTSTPSATLSTASMSGFAQ